MSREVSLDLKVKETNHYKAIVNFILISPVSEEPADNLRQLGPSSQNAKRAPPSQSHVNPLEELSQGITISQTDTQLSHVVADTRSPIMPQDMPPTGGYEPVQYRRSLPVRGFRPAYYLFAMGGIMAYGFYKVALGIGEQKYVTQTRPRNTQETGVEWRGLAYWGPGS